jgi:superoxide dismutase, Fe-Mn family
MDDEKEPLPTRREVLALAVAGSAGLLVAACTPAPKPVPSLKPTEPTEEGEKMAAGKVLAGAHQVVPLPFDPKKLTGLSEKLLVSHHENNYAGAVKNLNKVEADLAGITKDTPPYLVSGLKERELTFTNSKILHELYFGNLGGDGKAAGDIKKLLEQEYGSFDRWETEFRVVGQGLGGGSGWVILAYNFQTGLVQSYWSGGHTQNVAFGQPLLVMDILDYGAAAGKYIDAFFQNINWAEVDRRLGRAQKAAALLRG